MSESFVEFSAVAGRDGVHIDPTIIAEAQDPDRFKRVFWHAPGVYNAISVCAERLVHNPSDPLASSEAGARVIGEDLWEGSVAYSSLKAIINASLTPYDQRVDKGFRGLKAAGVFCASSRAEDGFLGTFEQNILNVRVLGETIQGRGARIIIDDSGRSIGYQKGGYQDGHRSEPHTALMTEDFKIDGIPYPAGSIVTIYPDKEYNMSVEPGVVRLLPAGAIAGMRYMRLSAYGEAPAKRDEIFDQPALDPLLPQKRELTLDEIRTGLDRAAGKLLRRRRFATKRQPQDAS